jgi:hypothetical protein
MVIECHRPFPSHNSGCHRDKKIERKADSFPEKMPTQIGNPPFRQGIRPRGRVAIRLRAEISDPTTSQSFRDRSKTASQCQYHPEYMRSQTLEHIDSLGDDDLPPAQTTASQQANHKLDFLYLRVSQPM